MRCFIPSPEERTALIKARTDELREQGFWALFKDSVWALISPVIVLGGIYAGFVTPTEAAAVSVFYALIVSLFVYRSVKIADLLPMLCASVRTYGGLAFVLAFATAFGRVLVLARATGAQPVPLAWSEVYIALKNKLIDAEKNAADTVYGNNLHEVQKYLAFTDHILYCNQICVNTECYNSLDPASPAALEQAVADAVAYMHPQLESIDRDNKALLEQQGMTLIDYDAAFYDSILNLDGVKALYSRIDQSTNGLADKLTAALG